MSVVMNSNSIGNRQLNCNFRDLNFEIVMHGTAIDYKVLILRHTSNIACCMIYLWAMIKSIYYYQSPVTGGSEFHSSWNEWWKCISCMSSHV